MNKGTQNKSILVDQIQHQKVKQLSERFNISLKQYIEDMIDYSFRTGFNPSIMKRDLVMEKLNQIQEEIKGPSKKVDNKESEIHESLRVIETKISALLKNSNEIVQGINRAANDQIKMIHSDKENFKNLSKDLLVQQHGFKKTILERHPNFMEGKTGLIPNSLIEPIKQIIISFDKSLDTYNKLQNKK